MSFFDTVAGHTFTEATLPNLVEELRKLNNKKQYIASYGGTSNISNAIQAEINAGSRVVSMVNTGSKVIVVYEM